jgi:hypothetical protein
MLNRIHRIFLDYFHRPVFQKNMMFRKLDLFPSSGEGGEKTPTQLGPLERANSITGQVSETSCFLEYRTMEKVQKNSVNSKGYVFWHQMLAVIRLLLCECTMGVYILMMTNISYIYGWPICTSVMCKMQKVL